MCPQQYLSKGLPHRKRDTTPEAHPELLHARWAERMLSLYWLGIVPRQTTPAVSLVACIELQRAAQMAGHLLHSTTGTTQTADRLSIG